MSSGKREVTRPGEERHEVMRPGGGTAGGDALGRGNGMRLCAQEGERHEVMPPGGERLEVMPPGGKRLEVTRPGGGAARVHMASGMKRLA